MGQWPLQATVLAALRPDSLGILTRKKNPTRFDSIICTLCKKGIILCVRFGMIVQPFIQLKYILMKRRKLLAMMKRNSMFFHDLHNLAQIPTSCANLHKLPLHSAVLSAPATKFRPCCLNNQFSRLPQN